MLLLILLLQLWLQLHEIAHFTLSCSSKICQVKEVAGTGRMKMNDESAAMQVEPWMLFIQHLYTCLCHFPLDWTNILPSGPGICPTEVKEWPFLPVKYFYLCLNYILFETNSYLHVVTFLFQKTSVKYKTHTMFVTFHKPYRLKRW